MVRSMPPVEPRRSYRCAAWGCPNTGCINDEGAERPGLCWQHFNETDRRKWGEITAKVRRNFAELRNHDRPLSEQPAEELNEADMFGGEVPA